MTTLISRVEAVPRPIGRSSSMPKDGRMYAIAFDMDTDTLKKAYGAESYNNAYADIRKCLLEHGFQWTQGSVYFADATKVNAVTCVMAVIDLAQRYPWFAASVRDIRMLRIEEQNDLMPAVERASKDE